MACKDPKPQLTPNNLIYLYQLLSRELGCGKQTFITAVEEALAGDRMTAEDLGFDSTRALLETLDGFIKLTVFKGGRIYATVIAQPAWDEALASLESGKAKDPGNAKPNKPWKRKKTDKALKPVRPKRVKRTEPEPEPAPAATTGSAVPESPIASVGSTQPADAASLGSSPADQVASDPGTFADADADRQPPADETPSKPHPAGAPRGDGALAAVGPESAVGPSPAISLTVTYDPYSGIDRETKLESHPVAPKAAQEPMNVVCAPSRETDDTACSSTIPGTPAAPRPASSPSAPEYRTRSVATDPEPQATLSAPEATPATPRLEAPTPEIKTPAPDVLATYPVDFSAEVYLASDRVADLCELLPYGTDVFALLAEDYARARKLELISGTRARATFPLRIEHADSTEPLTITLKKRSGSGLKWELAAIA